MSTWNRPGVGSLLGLAVSFFGSLVLAACFYPRPYYWRQTVMSALASPKDNPHAFGIACTGVALSAVFLLRFPALLHARLGTRFPRKALWASRCLRTGAILLFLTALVVPGHYRVWGVHRIHEQLARTAAAALCLALILFLRAVFRLPEANRGLRWAATVFVALPLAAFLVSRLALLYTLVCWPVRDYRAATVSAWGSLALWEWVGAGCIYLFLVMITFGLPLADEPCPAVGRGG